MAFDALMKFWQPSFLGVDCWPKGESEWNDDSFALTTEWRFSLENIMTVAQNSKKSGFGKGQFDLFTIKKQIDSASPDLYSACAQGAVFNEVTVSLYKFTGNPLLPQMNAYCILTMNSIRVQKVEWSYESDVSQETVTFLVGSCAISYGKQSMFGPVVPTGLVGWNQLSNTASITEEIEGNPASAHKVGLGNLFAGSKNQ